MTEQTEYYIPDGTYELPLQAIMHPVSPTSPRSDLIEALGEIGGIWPASCLDDNKAVK